MQTSYEDLVFRATHEITISANEIGEALSSSDPYMKWIGAKAAGQSKDEKWISQLKALAITEQSSTDPDLNTIAIWAIARLPKELGVQLSKEWAMSDDPACRRAAADLIGEAQLADEAVTLENLLDDVDNEVAKWAALSLAKLGGSSSEAFERVARRTVAFTKLVYCLDGLVKISRTDLAETIAASRRSEFSQLTEEVVGALKKQNAEMAS